MTAAEAIASAFIAEGLLEPTGKSRKAGLAERPELRLARNIAVEIRAAGSGLVVIVPAGYITDGYSLPGALLQAFQPRNSRWLLPALLHDWLYDAGLVDRAVADAILLEQMRAAGVNKLQRLIVFLGVRLGGWAGFAKPLADNLDLVAAARAAALGDRLTAWLNERAS